MYSDTFNECKIKLLFVNTFCQTYLQQKTEVTEILTLILLLWSKRKRTRTIITTTTLLNKPHVLYVFNLQYLFCSHALMPVSNGKKKKEKTKKKFEMRFVSLKLWGSLIQWKVFKITKLGTEVSVDILINSKVKTFSIVYFSQIKVPSMKHLKITLNASLLAKGIQ